MSDAFFTSRWIEQPEHVRAAPDARLAGRLPRRRRRVRDQAERRARPGAARLRRARDDERRPVHPQRHAVRAGALDHGAHAIWTRSAAVVVNSGNANASTGRPGLDNAAKMQGAAAIASGVGSESAVAVASTGVIGVQLPMDVIIPGIAAAARALRPDGAEDFAEAIRTTDAFAKRASLELSLDGGTVRLTAQAKGAGMISPGFATLLVFVQTDAKLSAETADLLLGVTVKRSFERISVDGQMSPSDTVILQAAATPASPSSRRQTTSCASARRSTRRCASSRCSSPATARARAASDGWSSAAAISRPSRPSRGRSPTRRSSRPRCTAATRTGVGSPRPPAPRCQGMAPLALDIAIEGTPVCATAGRCPYDVETLAAAVQRDEVEYEVGLPGTGAETEVFFSDLGHEYVTINADYTT